jgi:hypothetical protein
MPNSLQKNLAELLLFYDVLKVSTKTNKNKALVNKSHDARELDSDMKII